MVKNQVKRSAFFNPFEKYLANKKTKHLWYSKLGIPPYITSLDPVTASTVFKAGLNMYEIEGNFKKMYHSDISCPFCKIEDETFEHIFLCSSGVLCKNSLKENNLLKLSHFSCPKYLKNTGEFLLRYKKYREIMLGRRWCTLRGDSSSGWLCVVDLGFGFSWRVERMGGNVGGLLIISGAFLRLSVCLGDASGVRCGLLLFLSIFPFVAWPLMRGMQ